MGEVFPSLFNDQSRKNEMQGFPISKNGDARITHLEKIEMGKNETIFRDHTIGLSIDLRREKFPHLGWIRIFIKKTHDLINFEI